MSQTEKVTQRIISAADLQQIKDVYNIEMSRYHHQILVCAGAGCISSKCYDVRDAVVDELKQLDLSNKVKVIETGCMGTCSVGPVMLILPERTYYVNLTPDIAREILRAHLLQNRIIEHYTFYDNAKGKYIPCIDNITFFREQVRIALRNCGVIEYDSLPGYVAKDGYTAAYKAVTAMTRQQVVDEIKASGLRGRGGGGFPTGIKWEAGLKAEGDTKYIVCNADEGDPGAFMDRSLIEGDPHNLIEGMIIGGYAIGADYGYVYVRAEYPIAVERLEAAIAEARAYGLLGGKLFGTEFSFDIEIRIGAGAFVCGEETALMSSIEGQRGEPRQKPPFPFQRGLFGCPTIINNVETFCNIADIINKGAQWFSSIGTEKAKGTKVFALAGDIEHSGIIEVPIGTTLGDIIFTIGGGIPNGKAFKAAQAGGPSGGCITAENLNVPMDYDALIKLGAMMGSGGLIVMNEDTCMVDTARFFLDFIQDESCGKCTACRVGTRRMLDILERLTRGEGREDDLDKLEQLAHVIKDTAMCGLGQSAPNPVLSTLRYFRDEYEEHIYKKHCLASVCSNMYISSCQNACPASINIPGFMANIASGDIVNAYRIMLRDNPFSGICGRICAHYCENVCRRGTVDEPMSIKELKRFATDYAYSKGFPLDDEIENLRKNGKKVAIIGSGLSGLTCGYYLARLGYEIDVYEKEAVAGGILRYGVPEYRLPRDILQHEIDIVCRAGVNIIFNTEIGRDVEFEELQEKYDAVYIAIGAQIPAKLGIEGEDLDGVISGLDFLKRVALYNDLDLQGKKVAVIGGGNTAFDSARTAIRMGAEKVTILYRRTRDIMPASREEVREAIEEGVEIVSEVSPSRFIGTDGRLTAVECVRMQLYEFDRKGNRRARPIPGTSLIFEADVVIPSIRQAPDTSFITNAGMAMTKQGMIAGNRFTMATETAGVFAGGDVFRGSDDVVHAIHDAKLAAQNIDLYLGGKGELNKGPEIPIPEASDEDEIVPHGRFSKKVLSAEERKCSFCEYNLGFHKLDAEAEAKRCLRCDRR